jgi:hypothetical protein
MVVAPQPPSRAAPGRVPNQNSGRAGGATDRLEDNMHVMVAVGSLSAPSARADVVTQVEAALAGHAFTRAFPGVYVVTVISDSDRGDLVQAINGAIKAADPAGVVLISPAIPPTAGTYNGLLPPDRWAEINSRII